MAKTKLIDKVMIEKGKVTSVEFSFNGRGYQATVTPSQIKVSKTCVYSRKTKGISWYLEHCCGLQGFGLSVLDSCPACESSSGMTTSEAKASAYEPGLPEAIDDLSEYCKDLEALVGKKF